MTQELIDRSRKLHVLTDRTLVALIFALVAALAVAAVAVSIGIARADALDYLAGAGNGRLALAALLALILAGMGGLAAAMMQDGAPRRRD